MTLLKTITNDNKTLIMATHDYEIINKFPGIIIKFENNGIEE